MRSRRSNPGRLGSKPRRGALAVDLEVFVRRHHGAVIASVALETRLLRSIGYDEGEVVRWVKAWALSAAGL